MNRVRVIAILLLVVCGLAASAERPVRKPAEAVALVQRAAAYIRQHGRERALAAFNAPKGEFVDGELYIFAFDLKGDGTVRANAAFPQLVGKNLLGLTDPDGVTITKKILETANSKEGKGWINYKWPNPMRGRFVEAKASYIERAGDLAIGCGIPAQWAAEPKGEKR